MLCIIFQIRSEGEGTQPNYRVIIFITQLSESDDKMNQDPNYRMMFPSLKETNMLRCNLSHDYREARALFLILCLVSFITVLSMLPCLFMGTFPELEGKGERVGKT